MVIRHLRAKSMMCVCVNDWRAAQWVMDHWGMYSVLHGMGSRAIWKCNERASCENVLYNSSMYPLHSCCAGHRHHLPISLANGLSPSAVFFLLTSTPPPPPLPPWKDLEGNLDTGCQVTYPPFAACVVFVCTLWWKSHYIASLFTKWRFIV